jgi:chromosome segregation ATPase
MSHGRSGHLGPRLVVGLLCLGVLTGPLAQQATDDNARRSLARAQALLKQVNAQKVTAETELAKTRQQLASLEVEMAALKDGLAKTERSLSGTTRQLAVSERKGSALETRLGKTETRLRETRASLATTQASLKATEQARDTLEQNLDATRHELEDAERKNLELYRLSQDILAEHVGESSFQRLFRSEPLTGIRKVQLENLEQEYAHKLQDNLRATQRDAAAKAP